MIETTYRLNSWFDILMTFMYTMQCVLWFIHYRLRVYTYVFS